MPHMQALRGVAPRFVAATALLALITPASRVLARPAASESWCGLFMGPRKIGYVSASTRPAVWHGSPALEFRSRSVATLTMMGSQVNQDVLMTGFCTTAMAPLVQDYVISSAGSRLRIHAVYHSRMIECTVDSGGGSASKRSVAIPAGLRLVADSSMTNSASHTRSGASVRLGFLNPVTLSVEPLEVRMEGPERVTLGGRPVDCLRTRVKMTMGTFTSWETRAGETVRADMPLNMAMLRMSRRDALRADAPRPAFVRTGANRQAAAYAPPADFAVATSLSAGRSIPNARSVRRMRIRLSGLMDDKNLLADGRQRWIREANGTITMTVTARTGSLAGRARRPVVAPAMRAWLASGPYLETGAAPIRRAAREACGVIDDAAPAAIALSAWVHSRMAPDYGIGVPRSCVDVLKSGRGVCRDYATLFAGIARSAGIPTRLAGGIVCMGDRFFYHAWVECWAGEWFTLDPTLGGDFVDATHIKLAQGDVSAMYETMSVIGRLKVKVLSVE